MPTGPPRSHESVFGASERTKNSASVAGKVPSRARALVGTNDERTSARTNLGGARVPRAAVHSLANFVFEANRPWQSDCGGLRLSSKRPTSHPLANERTSGKGELGLTTKVSSPAESFDHQPPSLFASSYLACCECKPSVENVLPHPFRLPRS